MSQFEVGKRYRAKFARDDREGLIEVTGRDELWIYYKMVVSGFEKRNRWHPMNYAETLCHDVWISSDDEVVE